MRFEMLAARPRTRQSRAREEGGPSVPQRAGLAESPGLPEGRRGSVRPVTDTQRGGLLQDERDKPFVTLMAKAGLWAVTGTTLLYWPGVYRWWMTPLYLAVTMTWLFPPYTLMLHCVSHRPLFQKRFGWMNWLIPVVLAPWYGQTPFTYGAHHLGMHHPENNLWRDESTTLPFQRDSVFGFLRYVGRFLTIGLIDLVRYLFATRKKKLARRVIVGETVYWALVALLLNANTWATLTVFVFPLIIARIGMMCGNWGQHAFVDRDSPANAYRNSITCIEVPYNERCFNDGYHIVHHLQPRLHFTEMPGEFEANRARYGAEKAIVIRGLDFFQVWALLMVGAHRKIAEHMVALPGMPESVDERVALLHERLAPIPEPVTQTAAYPAAA